MKKKKTTDPSLVEILLALVFVLGGGILAILALLRFIDTYYPELNEPHDAGIIEILVAMITMLSTLMIGMFLGSLLLILITKPFYEKEEMLQSTKPHIPIYSSILRKFIEKIYLYKL